MECKRLDLACHLAHNLFHMITERKAVWCYTFELFGVTTTRGDLGFAAPGTVLIFQYTVY